MTTTSNMLIAINKAREDGFKLSKSTMYVSDDTYQLLKEGLPSSEINDDGIIDMAGGPAVVKLASDDNQERFVVGDVTYTL